MAVKANRTDNKSKRLRKKLYLGEYAVKGFELSFSYSLTGREEDTLFDDFIGMIEEKGLCIGGWAECAFIAGSGRYQSVTREDRTAVIRWLESDPRINAVTAGELVNANYFT